MDITGPSKTRDSTFCFLRDELTSSFNIVSNLIKSDFLWIDDANRVLKVKTGLNVIVHVQIVEDGTAVDGIQCGNGSIWDMRG